MLDEDVKTARYIMIGNGTSVPPLQLMIKAKTASLFWRPSISPCYTGYWTEWQYQQHNGFGEPPKVLGTAEHLPVSYTLKTVSYEAVNRILGHLDYHEIQNSAAAKISRYYAQMRDRQGN